LTAGVYSFAHGLSTKASVIQVYDNADQLTIPDDVEWVDTNNAKVDLTTFGVLTGTWTVVAISQGGQWNAGMIEAGAYAASWSGNTNGATKDSLYDKIEVLVSASQASHTNEYTVHGTGTQTIADGNWPDGYAVDHDVVERDIDGVYSAATDMITFTKIGYISIVGVFRIEQMADRKAVTAVLHKNGTVIRYSGQMMSPDGAIGPNYTFREYNNAATNTWQVRAYHGDSDAGAETVTAGSTWRWQTGWAE